MPCATALKPDEKIVETTVRTSVFRSEAWLAAIALASIAAIGLSAAWQSEILAACAATAFALAIAASGMVLTASAAETGQSRPLAVLRRTTRLSIWMLAWSAAALFAAYPLAGLKWQHGWQYASGYALLAVAFAVFLNRLSQSAPPNGAVPAQTRPLAMAFLAALLAAILWLLTSGKLMTTHQDWLANDVFLASAAAISVLTVLFLTRGR